MEEEKEEKEEEKEEEEIEGDEKKKEEKPVPKKSSETESRKKDLMFWILMIGFIALPLAATLLHIKLHNEDYPWLVYITAFDVIIISLMYFSRKTIFSGFVLNTTLFVVGIIAHISVLGLENSISDNLLAIPDFAIGYALWREYH